MIGNTTSGSLDYGLDQHGKLRRWDGDKRAWHSWWGDSGDDRGANLSNAERGGTAIGTGVSLVFSLFSTTTSVYDAVGNVLSVTDPLGNKTSTDYDALTARLRCITRTARRRKRATRRRAWWRRKQARWSGPRK